MADLSQALAGLEGLAGQAQAGAVVVVDSAITPPVTLSLASSGGAPSPLMRWLSPRVRVYVNGAELATLAPYGDPVPPDGASFVLGLALVAVGVGVAGYLLLRR